MSSRKSLERPRHHHHHFGRHRSGSYLSRRSSSFSSATTPDTQPPSNAPPRIFQGTDAVPQNRKVALQRVIDTHQALERKHSDAAQTPTSTSSDRPTSSSSSMSSDLFTSLDFADMSFPDAEVRAFQYLLRRWDPNTYSTPDPDFEAAIMTGPRKQKFEETAIKHFFSRVALWDASAQEKQEAGMTRSVFFFRNRQRRRRSRAKSDVGRMLGGPQEAEEKEDEGLSALKEVTTREGLAQLLWTLVHTDGEMVGLREECTAALKEMYRVTVTGVEGDGP
ncbi:hypothetical protein G6011_02584 [Alternaria panax]|uniref:Uncharacterized protein n=1 Tax=Alternaria panax TaxID=48097 RepID=A0AAD4I516_9PLEO|nr:hypothetical protein G6011_02584 [Alternaria panax]